MVRRPYSGDPDFASSEDEPCEARVSYLARQLAELVEYYEGIAFTLKRQRDAAHAELRRLKGAA
jgi:hypothetical protein